MALGSDQISLLKRFLEQSDFQQSLLALDLDGTALVEDRGKVFISRSVEKAVATSTFTPCELTPCPIGEIPASRTKGISLVLVAQA